MNLAQLQNVLRQASKMEGLEWIYFEGGEPFLHYPLLMRGVQQATALGFHVGIVTNAYWATTEADSELWLKPLSDLIEDLTISSDDYHAGQSEAHTVANALTTAKRLGIPTGLISVAQPEEMPAILAQAPGTEDRSAVLYRGRAAARLVSRATLQPWETFTSCPHEDLRNPGRVHLDPFGNLHICQGISIGNVFERSLRDICANYDVENHPICGPLLRGGPVGLVQECDLTHAENYADACHLCYSARKSLRERYPVQLTPHQMYGV
jgi:MoaA/NifB/PqqE/SkfB family radical SAM enzyme